MRRIPVESGLSLCFLLCLTVVPAADARGGEDPPFDQFRRVSRKARVHTGMSSRSATYAIMLDDAIVKGRLRSATGDCPSRWFERQQGGFVCSRHLKKTREQAERPSPGDDPALLAAVEAVTVREGSAPLYKKYANIGQNRPYKELRNGSVLTVQDIVSRGEKPYYRTRQGWFVPAAGVEKLPETVQTLGVDVSGEREAPAAIVIGRNARIFRTPSDTGESMGDLARWTVVKSRDREPLEVHSDYVALPGGGFLRDEDLARVRIAPVPGDLASDERWIAVDVEEQLVHAYEGRRLVRLMPCSTGSEGNTFRGEYRIQVKLRQQTMQLRMGQIRVEDVQWVMYYDKKDGIAIHSAYWHDSFGTPVSHGCVNLPVEDARWLFEWSRPNAAPLDSIRFHIRADPGSRVVVF